MMCVLSTYTDPSLRGRRAGYRVRGMISNVDLDEPREILREIERLDRCIEELQQHREDMKERMEASRGFVRMVRNLNFLNSQKQITRHLRLYKIHRERMEMHYERLHGEVPADYQLD